MTRRATIALLAALAAAAPLAAQRQGRPGPMRPRGAGPGPRAGQQRGAVIDRWSRMTPEQRSKALEKMPPERKKEIEKRLDDFGKLPPEQRRALRERYEAFSEMPPERQQRLRRVFRQFNDLPPDRRPLVREEIESLRTMSDTDRRARINSEEFRNKYTQPEQQMMEDLSNFLAPPPATAEKK